MKRRSFIQTSSLVTLPLMLGGMEVTAISKSSLATLINPDTDKVLVLVQLNGGNDGLNTFIPLDQFDNLMKVRSNIMLPETSILKTGDNNGFHPSMEGFKSLYDTGQMGVIQSVSYPNQNRSHFRSTDIWNSASDSEDYISTGWLGRHFDLEYPGYPDDYPNEDYPDPFAITLGYVVSETCQGDLANFSYATIGSDGLGQLVDTVSGEPDNTCYGMELDFVKKVVTQSNAYSTVVSDAFAKGNNMVDYPDMKLADQLKIVANLVSGGLTTKVYVVSLGGFDTHANQVIGGDTLNGTHTELMDELSSSIAAFQADINALGLQERVIGMTFSEFGRRIASNDGFGTDHGTAAPLFVFGGCVKGGIYGENPQISENILPNEGVPMQYDFRSIYASILIDWFEVEASQVRSVLFEDFQHIPFLKDCITTTGIEEFDDQLITATIYPNPSEGHAILEADTEGGKVGVQLYDCNGSLLKIVLDKKLQKSHHSIPIDLSLYASGNYFVRIVEGSKQKTLKIVKI